jgi:hypothetical protein
MERIASLIEQLQQALQRNADAAHLLVLTNMLQAELEKKSHHKTETYSSKNVAVVMPISKSSPSPLQPPAQVYQPDPPKVEEVHEKIVEVLQVDEHEVEAELEEIRQKAEFAKRMQAKQAQHKPPMLFEDEHGIPTLIHQPNYTDSPKQNGSKEVNEAITAEGRSINDQLKEEKTEVGHKLSESTSVKDLKKAIGINDRFVFINELFRGDEVMYERSIKTINNFSIYAEAQYWMERELKTKLGWDGSRPAVQEFYALVKRRFS